MTPVRTRSEGGSAGAGPKPGSRLWPILITLGLVFVVLVNAIFIYIAVSGADDVVPSYHTEER
ncbi:MAG: hypothetical protein PVJ76_14960 [Gemmatimonadota bacterium]